MYDADEHYRAHEADMLSRARRHAFGDIDCFTAGRIAQATRNASSRNAQRIGAWGRGRCALSRLVPRQARCSSAHGRFRRCEVPAYRQERGAHYTKRKATAYTETASNHAFSQSLLRLERTLPAGLAPIRNLHRQVLENQPRAGRMAGEAQ